MVTLAVVVVVAVVVVAYVLSLGGGVTTAETTPVPSGVLSQLSQVAVARYGTPSTKDLRSYSGSPMADGNKTVVLFVSGDFCPFCAAERWSVVMALMRFGNFSSLSYTYSDPNIEDPNTPSFSFASYRYASKYISFQAFEYEDRNELPLESVPDNYTAIWKGFPSNGTVPFLDIGNVYVVTGSQFSPTLLAGMTQEQVVQSIVNDDQLGKTIMAAADGITAAICNVTHGAPAGVCGRVHTSALGSFSTGAPSTTADEWANVQYTQTAWIRKASAAIR